MISRNRNRINNTQSLSSSPAVDEVGGGGGGDTDSNNDVWLTQIIDDGRRAFEESSPPASPANRDNYVVPPESAGIWALFANRIATWNSDGEGGWGFIWPGDGGSGVTFWNRKRQEHVVVMKLEQSLLPEELDQPNQFYHPSPFWVNFCFYLPTGLQTEVNRPIKNPVISRTENAPTQTELGAGFFAQYPLYKRWVIQETDPEYGSANGWGEGDMTDKIATLVSLFDQGDPENFQGSHFWQLVFSDPSDGDLVFVEDENRYIRYSSLATNWVRANTIEGIDVELTSLTDGQVLQYQTASGAFENVSVPGLGPVALDGLSDVVITSPSTGQTVTYNGTNWVNSAGPAPAPHTLGSHSDTTFSGLSSGQFARWNGSAWVNVGLSLSDLGASFAITSPTNGQALIYNSATSKFENVSVPGLSPTPINDLSDVVITSPSTGQLLRYNGTNWVNVNFTQSMLPNFPVTYYPGQVYGLDNNTPGLGGPNIQIQFPPLIGCRILRNPAYTGHLLSGGSPWNLEYEFGNGVYPAAGSFVTFLNPTSSAYQTVYSGTPSNFSNQEVFILRVPSGYTGYYRLTFRLRSNPETGNQTDWSSSVVDPTQHKWFAARWLSTSIWSSDPSLLSYTPDNIISANRIFGEYSGVIKMNAGTSALVFHLHSIEVNQVGYFQNARGIRSLDYVCFEKVG